MTDPYDPFADLRASGSYPSSAPPRRTDEPVPGRREDEPVDAPTETPAPADAEVPPDREGEHELDAGVDPRTGAERTFDAIDEEPEPPPDHVRSAVEWVAVIVGALVVALVVKTFLFQAFYIPSASMEPTLREGDRVLVNKLSYDLHDVNRGDVVVFELPPGDIGEDGIKDLIKRVIGLPGDVIETRDGVVYVNDRRLEEPYLADGTRTGDPTQGNNPPIQRQTVPEGTVFVMGDNRANSHDSRFADRGPIPIDSIVGRAFVLVWPPQEIGGL